MGKRDPMAMAEGGYPKTNTLNWSDKDLEVVVEQPQEGKFWCTLKMLARIKLSPDKVFAILTDPENEKRGVFRNVKVAAAVMHHLHPTYRSLDREHRPLLASPSFSISIFHPSPPAGGAA